MKRCSVPALHAFRSAEGELAGHSPGCGYWDRLLCSAAAAGCLPGAGYHGDQLPCVKRCDHEPVRCRKRKCSGRLLKTL